MKNKNILHFFGLTIFTLLLLPGCVKQSSLSKDKTEDRFTLKPFEKTLLEEEKTLEELDEKRKEISEKKKEAAKIIQEEKKQIQKIKQIESDEKEKISQIKSTDPAELDFYIQNTTGKTIYAVCFAYIQKQPFHRWRWDKTNIYKINNNQTVQIDVDYIKDEAYRKNVYGYLAIFDTKEKAENAIYELLEEKDKIALDKLYKLKNQKILIGVEKYGFKGEQLAHDIVPFEDSEMKFPELDFVVENKTGKTVLIACFVYQRKDDAHIWRFDKTPIIKLKPNDYGLIDVDSIREKYVRVYLQGYLAVFNEDQLQEAKESTFELLAPENKIPLGRMAALKNKKVVLEVEQYGTVGTKIDYTIHPLRRIDFKKALNLENY